jgi:hypothetical protein
MAFYFIGDEAMTPENKALRHLPIDLWQDTNDEDIEMIERLQLGRKSPQFRWWLFLSRTGANRLPISTDGGPGRRRIIAQHGSHQFCSKHPEG